jgi:hypothetical protein
MRKMAICLIVILGSWVAAFGQTPLPQWKVVQAVHLVEQTSTIPSTILFTPTAAGLYRVNVTATCGGASHTSGPSWSVVVNWATTKTSGGQSFVHCLEGNGYGTNAQVFSPEVGLPVTYSVINSNNPTFGYEFYIVIEKLQ